MSVVIVAGCVGISRSRVVAEVARRVFALLNVRLLGLLMVRRFVLPLAAIVSHLKAERLLHYRVPFLPLVVARQPPFSFSLAPPLPKRLTTLFGNNQRRPLVKS